MDNLPLDQLLRETASAVLAKRCWIPIGGYWWLPLPILQNTTLIAVNQPLADSCLVTQNQRGTKTGQNHGKIKSRTLCPKYPLWNIGVNGVGKTTTIGKLAYQFKKAGKTVYLYKAYPAPGQSSGIIPHSHYMQQSCCLHEASLLPDMHKFSATSGVARA